MCDVLLKECNIMSELQFTINNRHRLVAIADSVNYISKRAATRVQVARDTIRIRIFLPVGWFGGTFFIV